jgi:CheY-like chemotaxis protein
LVAGAHRPDVILLDIGMPVLNGYDAAVAIRAIDRRWRPLLIALTGWGQAEDRKRSQAAGFDHHVVKPLNPDDLQRLLKARAADQRPTAL